VQRPDSSSSTHSQPASGRPLGGGNINATSISKGETPVDFNSIGGTDTSKKCVGEVKSPRSPVGVEEGAPGGQGHHYFINAKVTVYAVLSGMISFLPDGTIHGCNHHFALMLLGYSQQELLKKVVHITEEQDMNVILHVYPCPEGRKQGFSSLCKLSRLSTGLTSGPCSLSFHLTLWD